MRSPLTRFVPVPPSLGRPSIPRMAVLCAACLVAAACSRSEPEESVASPTTLAEASTADSEAGIGDDSGDDSGGESAGQSTEDPVVELIDPAGADDALAEGVRSDDIALVAAALEAGADPDLDFGGNPAPHVAAEKGSVEMLELLLDAGADPDAPGISGHTALVRAALGGQLETMAVLLDRGVDLDARESSPGRTIIQLVIDGRGSIDAIEVLIDAGSELDAADDRGETALASAAFMNDLAAAELLVERGATVNSRNNEGITPLGWARQQGNDELVEFLEGAGGVE